MSFGTDPEGLTRDQLILYVKQLQRTVKHWQCRWEVASGRTVESLRNSPPSETAKGGLK